MVAYSFNLYVIFYYMFNLFRKFLPSIILFTIRDEHESPTTFKMVADASIIVR